MQKTIALITIHIGNNFGSILQTIATNAYLSNKGFRVIVIDYIPDRVTFNRYWRDARKSIKKFLWRCIYFPMFLINKNIYISYLKKYCVLSESIYTRDNFKSKCPTADIYLSGSDQIWNSLHNEGFDSHYFWTDLGNNVKKISLSSSIGRAQLDEKEKELFKQSLADFKAISVRENSAVRILSSINISAVQLLDPTFLLKKEDWKQFMSKRMIKENYVLLYLPYNIADESVIMKSANLIAKLKNLKIVTFSWSFFNKKYVDKTIKYANPGDFLSLMNYADYIITNSFHGTAFSINLNKQFWVYHPSKFSTRISSILELTHLENRVCDSIISEKDINTNIDYRPVNNIISQEIERTDEFVYKNFYSE